MSGQSEVKHADAIAAEILTPEAIRQIEDAILTMNAGVDKRLVLRLLYGTAYMDGMLAMAKVGVPQQ